MYQTLGKTWKCLHLSNNFCWHAIKKITIYCHNVGSSLKKIIQFRTIHWWPKAVILATWETDIRNIMVHGQCGQIVCETPIPKITRANWAGGVTQAVDCLFCKQWKALSSNPSPTKKIFQLRNRSNRVNLPHENYNYH
jgi:hypothetical protein